MSQLKTPFIQNDAVIDTKVRLRNNFALRARNAADSANINILKVNSSDQGEFGVATFYPFTPSGAQELVNKSYVDALLAQISDPKDSVRVASTANVTIATAPAAIDGVTLASGDRVLLKNQSTASENGIYVFNGTGSAMTRSTDFDGTPVGEVTYGAFTWSVEGTANARKGWLLTTPDPITVGTTALTFVETPIPGSVLLWNREKFTLNGTDISNGYKDLAFEVDFNSVHVQIKGAPSVLETEDYTLSNTGGVTRVTFTAALLLEIASGDILHVQYQY